MEKYTILFTTENTIVEILTLTFGIMIGWKIVQEYLEIRLEKKNLSMKK